VVKLRKQVAAGQLAFSVPQFCVRNHISRTAYNNLRARQRGPAEMRLGLNLIRITAEAEREWQLLMQQGDPELELRATERAVKAGTAAAQSPTHVSKRRARSPPS